MPLDNQNKINHALAMVRKTWAGRQQAVVFVSQSAGVWSYTVQNVIFRRQQVIDPEIPDVSGEAPRLKADAIMVVDINVSLVGVVYIANTATPTANAVASAPKYQVIEAAPRGILPGGTHWEVDLRYMR